MSAIDQLIHSRLVHRGHDITPPCPVHPSGFATLDQLLGGGLPATGVCRIQCTPGIGELRLLLSRLLGDPAKLSVLVAPPGKAYPDFWATQGALAGQLLTIQAQSLPQRLWSTRECLQSGCCQCVMLWQENISVSDVRRLQLAAIKGQACLWIMQSQPSRISLPLTLSLYLQATQHGLKISVTKRKGGWPAGPVAIDWQQLWPELVSPPAAQQCHPLQPQGHQWG